ncbi:hypothetical protein AB0G04_25420 [Actinoplanes sp. NPDC023801]|uniref:hypothetical protein n=1 Tax=Actinoplanes sp. NPDC023801 TaxID=3154595 RepID=UPI0033C55658
MTGTRLRLVLAALAVLLLAGGGSWWFLQRDPEQPAPVAEQPEAPDQQAQEDAVALIRGLPAAFASGDVTKLSSEWKAERPDLAKALPAGSTVEPDEKSWHRSGNLASMDAVATAPGEKARSYSVVMVLEDGTWRISGTYAKAGS